MQELGNAINDSLSESDRIAEAIGEIKRAGYDVFLVLEATIGFNRRDENAEDEDENQPELTEEPKPCIRPLVLPQQNSRLAASQRNAEATRPLSRSLSAGRKRGTLSH